MPLPVLAAGAATAAAGGAGAATAAAGGAGAGLGLGTLGWLGLGLSGGSLLGSLFSKRRRVDVPDISAEIARIRALYEQARQNAIANIRFEAGQTRGITASNLAARGIFRSPVSENVFGQLREATGRQIATAEATIGAEEAGTTSKILQSLLGVNLEAQKVNEAARQKRLNALFGELGSIGSTLLLAGLNRPATPKARETFVPFRPGPLNLPEFQIGYQPTFNPDLVPVQPGYLPALRQALRTRYGF